MTEATTAPVLSTPESHILEEPTPIASAQTTTRLTDAEIWDVYEIARTAREVREGGYRKAALQFPDAMLGDAARVFEGLERELKRLGPRRNIQEGEGGNGRQRLEGDLETDFQHLSTRSTNGPTNGTASGNAVANGSQPGIDRTRLYILADTSYGFCCVDEIAAEHVDADVVVHYGRSCLSPTARLPVIYVFTSHPIDLDHVVATFEDTFSISESSEEKVLVVADITYHSHITEIVRRLREKGYKNIEAPDVVHDPGSIIANRKVDSEVEGKLGEYALFHISDPPPALLLTLSSRVREMFIYPTTSPPSLAPTSTKTNTDNSKTPKSIQKAIQANTSISLRRRYALLTSLSTCPVFGILINTLSVRNHLSTVTSIKAIIERAGKKSYTFVVGKVNAAKIANFSEIGGWVVIGCWESSLIESTEFYRPIITPYELSLALQSDEQRVWTGAWRGDFAGVDLDVPVSTEDSVNNADVGLDDAEIEPTSSRTAEQSYHDEDSEEESAPPEFDLRTGRYISHSRPMRTTHPSNQPDPTASTTAGEPSAASRVLTRRAKGDLATVNGAISPGAEYLRSQRTWTGLGSDFDNEDASQSIEEGRGGIARGYRVGEHGERT